jgi:hypothetical protein
MSASIAYEEMRFTENRTRKLSVELGLSRLEGEYV